MKLEARVLVGGDENDDDDEDGAGASHVVPLNTIGHQLGAITPVWSSFILHLIPGKAHSFVYWRADLGRQKHLKNLEQRRDQGSVCDLALSILQTQAVQSATWRIFTIVCTQYTKAFNPSSLQ